MQYGRNRGGCNREGVLIREGLLVRGGGGGVLVLLCCMKMLLNQLYWRDWCNRGGPGYNCGIEDTVPYPYLAV